MFSPPFLHIYGESENDMDEIKIKIYDIAVVGLGPAGSVFCYSIDKKYSVIAIDKKSHEKNSFKKPCGGLLAPDAQKVFSHLELNLPKDVLVDPQIFSVKTICLDSNITRNYRRMYVNLDRHKFDMWMIDNIPKNIEVKLDSCVVDIKMQGDIYILTYRKGNEKHTVAAKNIVGADGAASQVRKMIYPKKKLRSYTAVQQWFCEHNPKPFYSCIFDSKNTDCCSWSISKDGYFIFGGAYPIKNAREHFEDQKKKLEKYGFVFGEPIKSEACLVLRPRSARDILSGKDHAYLIGEAAGLISPSSLEGVSYATESGYRLACAMNQDRYDPQKLYDRSLAKLRLKICEKLFKCPFMYDPLLRKMVMKSGITSIEPYYDNL